MRYALVKNNKVVNVVLWDGEGDIFSDYLTIPLDDDSLVSVGYGYQDGVFTPPQDSHQL